MQGKGFFRLIFHCGVKPKARNSAGRLIEDATGLLEWAADDRAVLKFTNMEDVKAKEADLAIIIHAWLEHAP